MNGSLRQPKADDTGAPWATTDAVHARIYSPSLHSWGLAQTLKVAGEAIGNVSLTCVVDSWRRATVAWTLRDPANDRYSVFARTYR